MNILNAQLSSFPIIGAIDNDRKAAVVSKSDVNIVFVLGCDICSLKSIINRLKRSNKIVFVHVDLVNGLGKDTFAVDYIKKETERKWHNKYQKQPYQACQIIRANDCTEMLFIGFILC